MPAFLFGSPLPCGFDFKSLLGPISEMAFAAEHAKADWVFRAGHQIRPRREVDRAAERFLHEQDDDVDCNDPVGSDELAEREADGAAESDDAASERDAMYDGGGLRGLVVGDGEGKRIDTQST